jgi:HEAT repeat protein
VDLLAELRKDQGAPQLDRVASDPRQHSAARLTCILAMYAAGEKLDTPSLISILDSETRLELRLVTILALMRSRDTEQIVPRLMKLLDDRNAEIRTAAVCALRGPKPPQAVPKLKEMIDELEPRPAMVFIFDVIGEIGTREAKGALADFMLQAVKDPGRSRYLSDALDAFETATGQRWRSAGAHNEEYYRQKAREALAWWQSQQTVGGPVVWAPLRQEVSEMDADQDGRIDVRRTTYVRGSEPVLVCVTRLAEDSSPKTVANSVFYQGQVAYVDTSVVGAPSSFSARSYPKSGAGVGTHYDANSGLSHVLLLDPQGVIVALFQRQREGSLKPADAEHSQHIRQQFLATQAATERLLQESADHPPWAPR